MRKLRTRSPLVETVTDEQAAVVVASGLKTHVSESPARHASRGVTLGPRWWVLSLALGMAFVVLAGIVSSDGVPSVDLDTALRIQDLDSPGWDAFLNFGESLTDVRGGLLSCAILAVGFWVRGLPAATVTIVLAPAILVPKNFIEEFIARPRPTADLVEITQVADGFSFPSGHVVAGVAVYGMLAIIAILSFRQRWARFGTVALVAVILVSSALSRVAFGAHWPTDVLGGLLLGAVWLTGLTWFHVRLERSGLANTLPLARPRPIVE